MGGGMDNGWSGVGWEVVDGWMMRDDRWMDG